MCASDTDEVCLRAYVSGRIISTKFLGWAQSSHFLRDLYPGDIFPLPSATVSQGYSICIQ